MPLSTKANSSTLVLKVIESNPVLMLGIVIVQEVKR